MKNPVVSVLLPFRNPGRYFVPAVESILQQSLGDFEVLLLDDGSSDESVKLAADFALGDARVVVIRAETSIGLSAQLNRGISHARGCYLARMDADDIAAPQRFERQVQLLEGNPDFGICGTLAQEFSDEGAGYRWILPEKPDEVFSLLFLRCCFNHPSVMIRASVMEETGHVYDESFVVAQDYELWYRLLKCTRGYNIQEPLLNYRRFPEQLSQASSPRKLEEVELIRRKMLSDLGLTGTLLNTDLHGKVAGDHWPGTFEWFENVVQWMNEVYHANTRTGVFPSRAFGAMLAEKLFLHCSMASRRGLDGWKMFRRAEFSHLGERSSLKIARMRVKALVRS